jgi:4-hydroxyphenylpyruvate dioxygenase
VSSTTCGGRHHPSPRVAAIDHLAICLEPGGVDKWTAFYKAALGMAVIHEQEVATEYSAMRSKALEDPSGCIKFVLVEPAPSTRQSQIEEYLTYYGGPGVQHIAFLCEDIISTAASLRESGIDLLQTPDSYYAMLPGRVGEISEAVDVLRDLGILVDRDQWGYLLQTFSRTVQIRPTLFIELIQRKNARGFGSGNIRALFEAVEREQVLRSRS